LKEKKRRGGEEKEKRKKKRMSGINIPWKVLKRERRITNTDVNCSTMNGQAS
jgi:hypothetical protein